MANLDQTQLNGGNYSELFISEPPPPYIPGTSASYANNTTVTGNSGTQFHVTEVSSGSQSAVAAEQKVTNLNPHSNQTANYVVSQNTQQNSYDNNSSSDDSLRHGPSLFIDLQGLDEKPSSGNSPIKSTPLEIPIQNPVIANLKASGSAYVPPVVNVPVSNSPPQQQSFMNPNQTSSQHNSRTATPVNSGTPINTPPTSLTAPLQKAALLQQANTSPVQMQPAPFTINMEQLQNNLQALGISPAQNGQWTMNPNAQLTTILSALGQQQQNVSPLTNVTAAQLTGQQVNPGLALAPQTLQLAPQQLVAGTGVGLLPSTSSGQIGTPVQTPHTAPTVQQIQQAVQIHQAQQAQQAQQQLAQAQQAQQAQQVAQVQQQLPVVQSQQQQVLPPIQQTQTQAQTQAQQMQQVHQQQQQQLQAQHAQQLQQATQAQLNQNQVQQPPNGMAVLQQDGSILNPMYGASSIVNSGTGQLQQFNAMQLNNNQIPQLAMYASNPVQQNVNVAALEHQLQADTLTLMMQMMKTMGELNKRMATLENEVDGLRQQVRQQQQQNMQLQQTLMTVQQNQQQPMTGSAQNPNETGQEDKSRTHRTNSATATNSNQILSLSEAPPVNSMGTNPRPGVVNTQYYQTAQNPYYYTTTNNGMQYMQPMATNAVPMPVPVGTQVPGYPGQVYYYTTAQQPTAAQGQQRIVYTNQRQ